MIALSIESSLDHVAAFDRCISFIHCAHSTNAGEAAWCHWRVDLICVPLDGSSVSVIAE